MSCSFTRQTTADMRPYPGNITEVEVLLNETLPTDDHVNHLLDEILRTNDPDFAHVDEEIEKLFHGTVCPRV